MSTWNYVKRLIVFSNYFTNPIQITRKENRKGSWTLTHHSGSNCHLWFSLGLENSTSQAVFMGRFGHILYLRKLKLRWGLGPNTAQMVSHCGVMRDSPSWSVVKWKRICISKPCPGKMVGLLSSTFPFCTRVAQSTLREITGVFALPILDSLWESFFLLESNTPQILLQKILVTEFYRFLVYSVWLCQYMHGEKSSLVCEKCNKVMETVLTKPLTDEFLIWVSWSLTEGWRSRLDSTSRES